MKKDLGTEVKYVVIAKKVAHHAAMYERKGCICKKLQTGQLAGKPKKEPSETTIIPSY